jgi:mono/diheme cytochrome c family protein
MMRPIVSAGVEAEGAHADPGRQLFQQSCASCHGANAQGLPHQGLPLDSSAFIAGQTDDGMLEFLRHGRQPTDPLSKLNLIMPARGSPPLRDNDLQLVISFLREVQRTTSMANANAGVQPSQ